MIHSECWSELRWKSRFSAANASWTWQFKDEETSLSWSRGFIAWCARLPRSLSVTALGKEDDDVLSSKRRQQISVMQWCVSIRGLFVWAAPCTHALMCVYESSDADGFFWCQWRTAIIKLSLSEEDRFFSVAGRWASYCMMKRHDIYKRAPPLTHQPIIPDFKVGKNFGPINVLLGNFSRCLFQCGHGERWSKNMIHCKSTLTCMTDGDMSPFGL